MSKSLKKRLKQWRKQRGLVQKQAADILGVNLRTYEGWEQGRPGPEPMKLAELERRLSQPSPP
jgi:transcriptional regulator with XRE-family HTH domain